LMEYTVPRHYVVRLQSVKEAPTPSDAAAQAAVAQVATVSRVGERPSDRFKLSLSADAVIGDALVALERGGIRVLTCRQERSEVEEAFLALTREERQ
jgi:hypothetical protein